MSRLAFRSTRGVASCPAVAGFKPAGAALAVAAAFGLQGAALAQPVPSQTAGKPFVVHGNATIGRNGSTTTVTTTNGAGGYSALNWQSFSIPAGTTTNFAQPNAASTSINRVVSNDPSSIFGTLSSNGRLVLVNQAGIAVGAGAVVNTAGFTAAAMNMSDQDLQSGRMRFSGTGGRLTVDGKIVTTSGDIVLIAPQIATGASALMESNGATVLAAGQKVELTGRGLEGIVMEVQAGNEAVNLGLIKGDAVGIFAGTLKHSGAIQAQSARAEGGKVVLWARGGEARVSGQVVASAGDKGGAIDVLGDQVLLLAGARLQANGAAGGGSIRVGGDYQGKNPGAAPNARRTYVDPNARIEANATGSGDGGRVIVWSDDFTRMQGQIAARGGALGGNGGFAEVSGKQSLNYTGRTDLRAPRGSTGTLLLDPNNILIVDGAVGGSTTSNQGPEFSGGPDDATITDADLNAALEEANVVVTTSGPSTGSTGGNITLQGAALVEWDGANSLTLHADKGMSLLGAINATDPDSQLVLEAVNGNITGNGAIRVGSLYATARGATSGPHTGGKVRLTGANKVGTLAGRAEGVGAEFEFNNAQAMVVGTVAGNSGIQVMDLDGSAGQVKITTAGGLSVSPSAGISGGSVMLTANGATSDLRIDDASVYASNGGVALAAGRDILVNAAPAPSAYAEIYGNGFLTLNAGRDIQLGTILPSDGSASTYLTSNGHVDVIAARNVTMSHNSTSAGASYVNVSAGSGGGGTGARIRANNGNADFGRNTWVYGDGAPIDVYAKNSILGEGSFITAGGDGANDPMASVTLTAGTGSASFHVISTSPSYGPYGGNVTVEAKTGITGLYVQAGGQGGGSSPSMGAGSGGTVTLHTTGGDIRMDDGVYADGKSYGISGGSGPGGLGGKIFITADTGNIDLQWGASASGGFGDGGGKGGEIVLKAGGNVSAGALHASGGSDMYGGGAGGNGGKVTVEAGQDITLLAGEGFSIYADGGLSSVGVGGEGGNVSLTAGRDVIAKLRPIEEEPFFLMSNPESRGAGIRAIGGEGQPGGKGGTVVVKAGRNVDITSIEVDGGAANEGSGTAGGAGGGVLVQYGGTLDMSAIFATGGFGSMTTGSNAGAGGAGGSIHLKRTSGDLVLTGDLRLEANGGHGGTASAGEGAQVWVGGVGGQGGDILVEALAGEVRLQSPDIHAQGGEGGTNSDGIGPAVTGGLGSFSAKGTVVRVEGAFDLNTRWINNSYVYMDASSLVTGAGMFQNFGLVDLVQTASLVPSGGVFNEAGGTMRASGSGSAVNVDLRTNAGLLEIGAGARMTTPFFDANLSGGTVRVDGTLDIHSNTTGSDVQSGAIGEDNWEFVNQGTLSGNGTVIVNGGLGVVRNAAGGVLAPGGSGAVGTLTLQSSLLMDAGSTYQVDIGPGNTADLLRANSVVTGGSVDVTALSGASFEAGALFGIVQASQIDAHVLPTVDPERFELQANGTDVRLVAKKQFPSPVLTPSTAPPPNPQAGDVQQVQNEVVTFANLFVQESERQALEERRRNQVGKDDIVITDTACVP